MIREGTICHVCRENIAFKSVRDVFSARLGHFVIVCTKCLFRGVKVKSNDQD